MYNEHFEFKLVRSMDDNIEEVVNISTFGEGITHDKLAEMFNSFLMASGFVGHSYVNENVLSD
jgi:hypothetical protein